MTDLVVGLAITGGFWGQVFEYWPFTFTVAFTLVFGLITIAAEVMWRRKVPPPVGAMARIDIPVDPRVIPRLWIKRGLTLLRFGCGLGIFLAFLFVSFALNPPGAGENYGLEIDSNTGLVIGAMISFAAVVVGYWGTVTLRRRPGQMAGLLGGAAALTLLGPLLTTGEARWFGVGIAIMGLPAIFMMLGAAYTLYGSRLLEAAVEVQRNGARDEALRGQS
jgi:hypothetical protein